MTKVDSLTINEDREDIIITVTGTGLRIPVNDKPGQKQTKAREDFWPVIAGAVVLGTPSQDPLIVAKDLRGNRRASYELAEDGSALSYRIDKEVLPDYLGTALRSLGKNPQNVVGQINEFITQADQAKNAKLAK